MPMLESYRLSYERCADGIIKEDWRHANKNDLINKYIEVEEDPKLRDAYISAIIVRYWGALDKYKMLSGRYVTPDMFHEWLVDAILKAIRNRKWKDPSNKLYNDPNGPDKVVNRCIISRRLEWFQRENTKKRHGNFLVVSIDKMLMELDDAAPLPAYDEFELHEGNIDIARLISSAFDNGEYVLAFMVDGIINYYIFDKVVERVGENGKLVYNEGKLLRHLHALNDNFVDTFSELFNKKPKDVKKAISYCNKLSDSKMKASVHKNMRKLQRIFTP